MAITSGVISNMLIVFQITSTYAFSNTTFKIDWPCLTSNSSSLTLAFVYSPLSSSPAFLNLIIVSFRRLMSLWLVTSLTVFRRFRSAASYQQKINVLFLFKCSLHGTFSKIRHYIISDQYNSITKAREGHMKITFNNITNFDIRHHGFKL